MSNTMRISFWAALFVLPLFLAGQRTAGVELSERDQKRFDALFFDAQRYKQIERYADATSNLRACYKLNPKNATVAFELGKLLFVHGQQDEGMSYLLEAYNLAPENQWISLELANRYRTTGKAKEAAAIFEALAISHPNNLNYKYELAQLYFTQKKYKACISQLNEIETFTGINAELANQKKDIYLLLNDGEGALREMQKLVAAYPANLDYKGALARFYMANEAVDKAIAVYHDMIVIAPNDPRAHLDLANIYQNRNQYDTSYFHLQKAMASAALEIDAKIQVLYSFYQAGEDDTVMQAMGLTLLAHSLEATPREPKLYAMRADFYLRMNKEEAARNDLRKASRLGANQLQIWSQILLLDARLAHNDSLAADGAVCVELYPNQPLGYLMAGTGNTLIGEENKAIDFLEAGLDYVIENPELEEQFYLSLADAYHRINKHKDSDSYFEKALGINPRNPSTLNNYAFYLSERGVALDKALEMTQTCNNLVPNNGVFLDTWAWVLYKKANYSQALEKIEEALKYGGDKSGEVLEHYGDILFKLGRIEDAVAAWKRALEKEDASSGLQNKIAKRQVND